MEDHVVQCQCGFHLWCFQNMGNLGNGMGELFWLPFLCLIGQRDSKHLPVHNPEPACTYGSYSFCKCCNYLFTTSWIISGVVTSLSCWSLKPPTKAGWSVGWSKMRALVILLTDVKFCKKWDILSTISGARISATINCDGMCFKYILRCPQSFSLRFLSLETQGDWTRGSASGKCG